MADWILYYLQITVLFTISIVLFSVFMKWRSRNKKEHDKIRQIDLSDHETFEL